MELYLLGSLMGLGYYLNSTKEPVEKKRKYPKKMYRGNAYDFEQYDRVEDEIYDRGKVKFDEAQNIYNNNTVGKYTPDVLFDKKKQISHTKDEVNREKKGAKEGFGDYGNSIRSDFCYVDDDGNGFPCNDTNKKLSYSDVQNLCKSKKEVREGFSDPSPLTPEMSFSTATQNIKSYNDDDMDSYNLDQQFNDVSKGGQQGVKQVYGEKPFHNNMVPFFGGTMKQNVDPSVNETKLNMYTGQWDYSRKQKQEIAPMFVPEKNIKNVYGDKQFLQKMDENLDRYIPSLLRTNEAPTEKVYVTPGLNLGYNEVATFGFQDPVRALPKTTNELRAKNKPKLTYDRPVVSGRAITQNGTSRPNQNKNLPELVVYNQDGQRNFGAKSIVLGEMARPVYLLGRALRSFSTQFFGAATSTAAKKSKSNAGYTNSDKRQNLESKYIAPAVVSVKKNQVVLVDKENNKAKLTRRQGIEKNEHSGYFNSVYKALTNYVSPAKETMRENTATDVKPMNLKSVRVKTKAYFIDEAKQTIKQTTELNTKNGNLKTTRKLGKAYDPEDKAKATIREKTEKNSKNGNLKTTRFVGKSYNPEDKARKTVRETTENNTNNGNMGSTRKALTVYDPEDKARKTVKETTENNTNNGNMGSTRKALTVYDPEDKPEATMKDVVKVKNYKGISTVATKKIKVWDPEDKAKNTIRQSVKVEDYQGGINSNQYGGAYKVTIVDPKYTSRQETLVENYTGTAGHTVTANQEYCAAYAAETNGLKEEIAKGRAPTQNSVKLAVGGDMQNVDIKRLDSDRKNPRDFEQDMPNCDVPYQLPPTANPASITKEKNTVFNNYTERIQPDILDAYRNNPYTQSLHSYVFP
jgi:hypothetical protein